MISGVQQLVARAGLQPAISRSRTGRVGADYATARWSGELGRTSGLAAPQPRALPTELSPDEGHFPSDSSQPSHTTIPTDSGRPVRWPPEPSRQSHPSPPQTAAEQELPPAVSADVATGLFTHFKREEDETMTRGKLDEELSHMGRIVDHIGPGALLPCNESFASTNEREGSEIGHQVIGALNEGGVKLLLVTRLFELTQRLGQEAPDGVLFLRAERLPGSRRCSAGSGPRLGAGGPSHPAAGAATLIGSAACDVELRVGPAMQSAATTTGRHSRSPAAS